jgi:hypothetical protein
VIKIERDGCARTKLVVLELNVIPGEDVNEKYIPVIVNTSFRNMLTQIQMEYLKVYNIHVDTAFLRGSKDTIYIDTGVKSIIVLAQFIPLKSIYDSTDKRNKVENHWRKFITTKSCLLTF